MPKLYVPACGDRITLIKPWQFPLYLESRNLEFARTIGLYTGDERWADMPSAVRAPNFASLNLGQTMRLEGWA